MSPTEIVTLVASLSATAASLYAVIQGERRKNRQVEADAEHQEREDTGRFETQAREHDHKSIALLIQQLENERNHTANLKQQVELLATRVIGIATELAEEQAARADLLTRIKHLESERTQLRAQIDDLTTKLSRYANGKTDPSPPSFGVVR